MFARDMEDTEQLIAIPVDEYAELIECRTQLNAVYGMLTSQHVLHLKKTGHNADAIPASLVEIVSGYAENENHFECLSEIYRRENND